MRKTSWCLFLIVTLVLIAGSLTACARDRSRREVPQAVQGTLDLTHWNFTQQGPVPLNGEWEFYWKRHLQAADLAQTSLPVRTGFIEVPGLWNGYAVGGQTLSGDGYATYRLNVLLGQPGDRLAFKFLDMATAFSVQVNGRHLLSVGVPGPTPHTTIPRFHPQVIDFQPASDRLDIVIRVANFHHRKGGVWEAIRFGAADDIRASRERTLLLSLALTGSFVIMGLYHLGLFALRPSEPSPLYFGLFCLLIALRTLTTGERYLIELMPAFDWEALMKITYLTFYLGVLVFAGFVRSLFPQDMPKKALYLIGMVSLVFASLVLILPARLYTHTLTAFQIVAVLSVIYGLYVLILASIRKREGALVFLTGFAALSLTTLNDILYANLFVPT
ncbi:MAG: 7TM-DISM domain-containing protein, partial [Candidatus Tectomicrobia bacterium]|nr:7TM-DISM domain-containing protein [Candidatus Tectomicrobia bacterium]